MKKQFMVVGLLAWLLLGFTVSAQAIEYSGSLTGDGGGIIASDGWNNTSTVFSWNVKDVGTSGGLILWEYDYTLTVPSKNISHVIIEVSPDSTQQDFSSGTWDTYSATNQGNSNPGMPSEMTGLKFGPDGLSFSFSFTTTRAPVWGDFYAKDGTSGGVDVTAWNNGFGNPDTDPTAPASNGSVDYHILRPDTNQTTVPEPGTLLLIGAGLVGLVGFSRRKK